MGAEIEYIALGELVDPSRGISYGVVQPGHHVVGGVPIIRVTDIRDRRINASDPIRVSHAITAKHQRTLLRGGELLLTLVGTVGETAVVPPELAGWNTARAVGVVPVLADPGARWVQYALQTGGAREYIHGRLNTTVQATLNLRDVALLPVPMPSRQTRDAILGILTSLDDKIDLNRRMNETLEAMARALFKSWFVDFDPVRAKAEGRAPSGMDAETAKLFPSEFVNSEMGAIPKGWRTGTVANLAALEREVLNPTAFANEMFDHYSLPAFDAGRRPKQERGGNIMSGKLVVGPHCVLLSKLNPHIPRIWMPYVGSAMRSICSTEFLVASPMRDVPREFLFLLFTSEAFSSTYRTFVTGTTGSHQRIGVSSVLGMGIVLPPPAAMNAMATALAPMFDRINRNAEQTRTESTIRDALLPRLLSGEVAIGHAERETEAVA